MLLPKLSSRRMVINLPYQSNSDLPARVREGMPEKAQSIFREVFNSIIEQEEVTESSAFAQAYGAVENAGYKQNSNGNWGKVEKSESWSKEFEISKMDEDKQLVFGWLSIASDVNGNIIKDADDDIIEESELEKAAYNHVLKFRKAGEVHEEIIGDLVESMVFTKEKRDILGIPEGIIPTGWWVGYKLTKMDAFEKVKSGIYSSFSVGGRGRREIVEE